MTADSVYFLTVRGAGGSPVTPPPLVNHGHYVISLNTFVKWLAGQAEAAGIDTDQRLLGASEVLYDGIGVSPASVRATGAWAAR